MQRKSKPLLAIFAIALLLGLAVPAEANHPNNDPSGTSGTTVWTHQYVGNLSCRPGGESASTPTIPHFIVGWNDHGHVDMYIDVLSGTDLGCMGRIEVQPVVWMPAGAGKDDYHDNDPCHATKGGGCDATHFFAFVRDYHNVSFYLDYCIQVSYDLGITWKDPSDGRTCNRFWFGDPPLVEGSIGSDGDTILGGTALTFYGTRVI